MEDVPMDLSSCYVALLIVKAVIPISKVAAVLSSSCHNSRVSDLRKVN